MLALANLAAWVVQTTILVAVALAAIRLLRLDAPAVRYHFLRALLVICLALPFVQPRVDQVVPRQQAPAAASAPSATRVWSSAPRELGSRMPLSLPDAALMLRGDRGGAALLVDRRGILAPAPPAAGW